MPEFIESVYVHRPVKESDIPRRGAPRKRARGKKARQAEAAPATAMMTQAAPPGPWTMTARQPLFRPEPPAPRSRFDDLDLTPLFAFLFCVWILISYIYVILG